MSLLLLLQIFLKLFGLLVADLDRPNIVVSLL